MIFDRTRTGATGTSGVLKPVQFANWAAPVMPVKSDKKSVTYGVAVLASNMQEELS